MAMYQFENLQPQEFSINHQYSQFEKPDVYPKILEARPYGGLESTNVHSVQTQASSNVPTFRETKDSTAKLDSKNRSKGDVDTSSFTIEERLIAAVWVHERARSKLSIGQIKRDFKHRFEKDPPTKNTLLIWEKKLFSTGNVMDAKRSGRPCQRKEHIQAVQQSVTQSPGLSLRARATALSLPRTTLRKILCDDLRVNRSLKKKIHSEAMVKRKKVTEKPPEKPLKRPIPKMTRQQVNRQEHVEQEPQTEIMHHHNQQTNQQPNPISYHGYGELVVPMHLPEFHPYINYQNPAEKTHVHQTSMPHVGHQHYVVGTLQGNHML